MWRQLWCSLYVGTEKWNIDTTLNTDTPMLQQGAFFNRKTSYETINITIRQ